MTITKWTAEGCPVAKRGRAGVPHEYRESDVRAWLEERRASREGTTIDLTAARTRKELALAILSELKAAELRKDLLPREEVERQQVAEATAVRSKLLSWSTTIADAVYRAATIDGLDGVERVIERRVYEVLGELTSPDRPIECPSCGADLAENPVDSKPRCNARTSKGERCRNAAGEDGYCHVASHGPAA